VIAPGRKVAGTLSVHGKGNLNVGPRRLGQVSAKRGGAPLSSNIEKKLGKMTKMGLKRSKNKIRKTNGVRRERWFSSG